MPPQKGTKELTLVLVLYQDAVLNPTVFVIE